MIENITGNSYLSTRIVLIKSAVSSHKQTLILGLSSSLTAGAAYSYIVSMDLRYFTPALGIVAGLVGGLGIVARDILSEKERFEDIPLKDLIVYILFGIIGLFLGYIFVYYFVKPPIPGPQGVLPSEKGTIYVFFKDNLGLFDIIGSILGSISSSAIPVIFKKRIMNLMKKLKINQVYSDSK